MNVRIFGYRGLKMIRHHLPTEFHADSVKVLDEPYLWRQTLQTDGLTAVASATEINDKADFIRVEVPDGQKIRYEIRPPTRSGTDADANSPGMAGIDYFPWGEGYTISIIDAADAA